MSLQGKRILLGVSGGIAAYKAPELVRQLTSRGADVQVVLTRAAQELVSATALQAVSGHPVRTTLWDAAAEAGMGHIELARWADAILIAPATAHTIARLTHGEADDLLSTLVLAAVCPIALAPAMNVKMWEHAATRRNVERLREDGVRILGPGNGPQACGDFGPGRMLEPDQLAAALGQIFAPPRLAGVRVLITAGPTREPLDPVRYVSNHSSGRQGFAIAAAARAAGATVRLVTGPVALPTPDGVERIDVTTAREMHAKVVEHVADCDIFIGVAAVADFRPEHVASEKIKKKGRSDELTLKLVQNPDIIVDVARRPNPPLTIGFAAETHDTLDNARQKRKRKGLDLIVVNDVSDTRIGFNSELNAVTLVAADGETTLPMAPKAEIARQLIERIADLHRARAVGATAERGLPLRALD